MGLHRGEDSTLSRVEEVLVNDGDWHHLQLDISSLEGAASHHKAVLSLDQGLYLVSWRFIPADELRYCSLAAIKSVPFQASMEVDGKLRDSKLKTVSVGGLERTDGKIQHGFRGCIQVRELTYVLYVCIDIKGLLLYKAQHKHNIENYEMYLNIYNCSH